MRRIAAADYVRMPWKNGGGTTTEILKAGGESERFEYRISVAEVASDGPFSHFDGYDRHIMVLEGAGMTLDCGPHGKLTLAPLVPVFFSGDWDVSGTLASGPVRDFNVIVDRTRWHASVALAHPGRLEADMCILHIFGGDTLVSEGSLNVDAGVTGASVRLFRS